MKVTIEKACSSSTLFKIRTIASSTSLKYSKILFIKITLKTNLFHIQVVGLDGGYKKN
jgi:hypothetical protein